MKAATLIRNLWSNKDFGTRAVACMTFAVAFLVPFGTYENTRDQQLKSFRQAAKEAGNNCLGRMKRDVVREDSYIRIPVCAPYESFVNDVPVYFIFDDNAPPFSLAYRYAEYGKDQKFTLTTTVVEKNEWFNNMQWLDDRPPTIQNEALINRLQSIDDYDMMSLLKWPLGWRQWDDDVYFIKLKYQQLSMIEVSENLTGVIPRQDAPLPAARPLPPAIPLDPPGNSAARPVPAKKPPAHHSSGTAVAPR